MVPLPTLIKETRWLKRALYSLQYRTRTREFNGDLEDQERHQAPKSDFRLQIKGVMNICFWHLQQPWGKKKPTAADCGHQVYKAGCKVL